MIVFELVNDDWPLADAPWLDLSVVLVCNVNLVFASNTMECCHAFGQTTLYHPETRRFVRFPRNWSNDPDDE